MIAGVIKDAEGINRLAARVSVTPLERRLAEAPWRRQHLNTFPVLFTCLFIHSSRAGCIPGDNKRPHSEPRPRGRDNWWPKYCNITGNMVVKVETVGALKLKRQPGKVFPWEETWNKSSRTHRR